jgi:hypothetical protein
MPLSPELARFLVDHATAESRAVFASGVNGAPTAANLAAAMRAKGYQVGDADIMPALEASTQSALADRQLDGVVGGASLQALDNNLQADMSMIANILDKMNALYSQIAGTGG